MQEAPAIALIGNPGSGSGDSEDAGAQLRAEGAEVECFRLDDAESAAHSGAERLVVAGGDGSVGPAAAAAASAGIPLAVIAAGTANDFARRMRLPTELAEACLLATRGQGRRALDLGRMRQPGPPASAQGPPDPGRPFVNVASLGLPAPAAERASSWKSTLGPLAYAAGAIGAGLTAKPIRCRATCAGELVLDGRAWQLTVACSGAFGGGSQVDEADPSDGALDLIAVEAGSRLRLLLLAYGLRRGRVSELGGVRHARGATIEIDAPPGAAYNVDGELVHHGPATFAVEARAFELVVG